MNATLLKVYGFFVGVSLLAFLVSSQFVNAQNNQTVLSQRDQTRAINLAANITTRMEATNFRLQNIAMRLKANKEFRENDHGRELPLATEKLDQANNLINQNNVLIENIFQKFFEAITSAAPKTAWLGVKNDYLLIESQLKQTYNYLEEVVILLEETNTTWYVTSTETTSSPTSTITQNATSSDI